MENDEEKIIKKQSKTKGANEKDAAGDNKVHDIPSTLQEGPVPRGKNKKSKTKQSTTLAPSKQKKSSGLVGSVKNHGYFKHESKNIVDLRQKRNQTDKKWKKDPRD